MLYLLSGILGHDKYQPYQTSFHKKTVLTEYLSPLVEDCNRFLEMVQAFIPHFSFKNGGMIFLNTFLHGIVELSSHLISSSMA